MTAPGVRGDVKALGTGGDISSQFRITESEDGVPRGVGVQCSSTRDTTDKRDQERYERDGNSASEKLSRLGALGAAGARLSRRSSRRSPPRRLPRSSGGDVGLIHDC